MDTSRGRWTASEDTLLRECVRKFGPMSWNEMAKQIPGRSGKSCRYRWLNQLNPAVNKEPFGEAEDVIIIAAHIRHGNKWAKMAQYLPGRTDNAIKNHWNTSLKRQYQAIAPKDLSILAQLPLTAIVGGGRELDPNISVADRAAIETNWTAALETVVESKRKRENVVALNRSRLAPRIPCPEKQVSSGVGGVVKARTIMEGGSIVKPQATRVSATYPFGALNWLSREAAASTSTSSNGGCGGGGSIYPQGPAPTRYASIGSAFSPPPQLQRHLGPFTTYLPQGCHASLEQNFSMLRSSTRERAS